MDQRSVATGYVPEIDGIRAVAIGAVIVFHLWPSALPGGFTGVDMFFVVSGFVVTRSLLARDFASFRALALDFYARRAVRIIPALTIMLLATLLATQLFVPQGWLAPDPSQVGLAAFFGFSNLVLMNDANSYFAPVVTLNPFTHTWSLGIEEQFYLVFPLLLYWNRQSGQQVRMWLIVGLSLLSLILSAYLGVTHPKPAFYSIFSRFWELGTGVLLCLTHARWRPKLMETRPAFRTVFVLVCISIIAAGLAFAAPDFFPFPLALLSVLGTAGLIAAVCSFPGLTVAALLRSGPAVSTGRLSYSLYLWHWPVIVLFRWTVGLGSLAFEIGALVTAVTLALISYRLVERPLRASASRGASTRGGIIRIGLGSTALAYLSATILVGNHQHLSLSVTRDRATWYAEPDYPLDPALTNCSLRQQEAVIASGSRIGWSRVRCKSPAPASRIFVVGDSHGVAYTPSLRQFAAETGATVIVYFRAGCPFVDLLGTMASRGDCRSFYERVLDEVRTSASVGDVIFLPGLRLDLPAEQGDGDPSPRAEHIRDEAIEEAATVLRTLSRTGAPVIFEAPKPVFKSSAFRCADWFNQQNSVCSGGLSTARNDLLVNRQPVIAAARKLASTIAGVSVWDPFDTLCPQDPCQAMRGDKPLFFDSNHLSGYGNSVLYSSLRRALLSARSRS